MGFFSGMADKIIEAGHKERARREAEKVNTTSSLPPDYEQNSQLEQASQPLATKSSPIKIISIAVCSIFAAFFLVNALSSHPTSEQRNILQDNTVSQPMPESQLELTEDNLNLAFTDSTKGRVKLTLNSVVIGSAGVDRGVVYRMHLDEAARQNKEVYYFNVTLKNVSGAEEESAYNHDFKLEDNDGNTYKDVTTQDAIRGGANIGKKVSGGISFHVNKGNYPVRLVYDTKYVVTLTGEKKFSYLDNLQKIAVIKRFAGSIIPTEPLSHTSPTTEKSSDGKTGNWFVINGRQCEPDKGPSDLIANLQKGGLQYNVEDLKTEAGKPIIVKIDIFESLGSTSHFYYRGKEICLSEISTDKKMKAAEVDKYR